jgi:transcriptional regulator with XRE-family HTH domain
MRRDRRDLRTTTGRAAARLRAKFGSDVARLREDAGVSLRALAREADVDPSHLSAIEHGDAEPSLATASAIGAALGADVSFRLYPNTGPRIRDRLQAAMVECFLRESSPTWDRHLEVAVRWPVRGFIDAVLIGPGLIVAAEFHSEIRRLEQLVRWSSDKAAALSSADRWPEWSRESVPRIDRVLVVRSTRHNRQVVGDHLQLLKSVYPGDPISARRALAGSATWPGSSIIWMRVDAGGARLLDRLPPGQRGS